MATLLLVLAAAWPSPSPAQQPGATARAFPSDPAIFAIIKQRVAEKRSAGIVVGLVDRDGHTRIVAWGDPGLGQLPLDGNSVFEIGSITKVFTATVLAQMVLEGKVSLNDAGNVVPNWDIPTLAGAGATRSTAIDMLTFVLANLHPERGAEGRAMAFAQQDRAPAGGATMHIGLNWMIRYAGGDTIVWHNGGTGGYRTFIAFEPSRRMGVVVLTNGGNAGADDIGMHLLNPRLPLAPKPTPIKQRT